MVTARPTGSEWSSVQEALGTHHDDDIKIRVAAQSWPNDLTERRSPRICILREGGEGKRDSCRGRTLGRDFIILSTIHLTLIAPATEAACTSLLFPTMSLTHFGRCEEANPWSWSPWAV